MKKDDAKTVFIDTPASDGVRIALHMWLPAGSQAGSQVKTAVVLSHGMAEHAMRYEGFARFLCENGIAFYAHDHRGHGQTAQNADYAKQQHSGLYQVERGNPKRVFEGPNFRERHA